MLAGDKHLAGIGAINPEQDSSDLGATGADEAGEAEDLAAAHLKRGVAEDASAREAPDLQGDLAYRRLLFRK